MSTNANTNSEIKRLEQQVENLLNRMISLQNQNLVTEPGPSGDRWTLVSARNGVLRPAGVDERLYSDVLENYQAIEEERLRLMERITAMRAPQEASSEYAPNAKIVGPNIAPAEARALQGAPALQAPTEVVQSTFTKPGADRWSSVPILTISGYGEITLPFAILAEAVQIWNGDILVAAWADSPPLWKQFNEPAGAVYRVVCSGDAFIKVLSANQGLGLSLEPVWMADLVWSIWTGLYTGTNDLNIEQPLRWMEAPISLTATSYPCSSVRQFGLASPSRLAADLITLSGIGNQFNNGEVFIWDKSDWGGAPGVQARIGNIANGVGGLKIGLGICRHSGAAGIQPITSLQQLVYTGPYDSVGTSFWFSVFSQSFFAQANTGLCIFPTDGGSGIEGPDSTFITRIEDPCFVRTYRQRAGAVIH